MGEKLFELGRRTFDTPHFRGIEFIEAEAKSIINPVKGSYLPFNWTINPYRGCSHACTYCAVGDTPILMASGRTKPLAEVRAGDSVYGTVRRGRYRHYVVTEVLDHWQTVRPAHRVRLRDGTEIITSGDHRFLTKHRGWKHVADASGCLQRPHLTSNNELMGVGVLASGPEEIVDYRRGYLCGLIRGDGSIGSYEARRGNGHRFIAHRSRLALVDLEAIRRADAYFRSDAIVCREFVFQEATARRGQMSALRSQTAYGVGSIRSIIEWPRSASVDWAKGFLAGIFDAEGSRSDHVLRISNTDIEIINRICKSLDDTGFDYATESSSTDRARPLFNVRLRGGLREQLRFLLTVDPAITRKRRLDGIALKPDSDLRVESIEPLGVDLPMFDITTGTGDFIMNGVVSHIASRG